MIYIYETKTEKYAYNLNYLYSVVLDGVTLQLYFPEEQVKTFVFDSNRRAELEFDKVVNKLKG